MQVVTSYLNNCARADRQNRQILKIDRKGGDFLTLHFKNRAMREDVRAGLRDICVPMAAAFPKSNDRDKQSFRLMFNFGAGHREGTLKDSFDVLSKHLSGAADRRFLKQVQRHIFLF